MRPTGLSGKTALVTGAARGIGAAVALALRAEGMRVVALDVDGAELAEFVAAHGGSLHGVPSNCASSHGESTHRETAHGESSRHAPAHASDLPPLRGEVVDVSDPAEVDALVERVEADWGPIDAGVNVAGVVKVATVAETSDADWRAVFAVNADGVFHVSRALARRMAARGRGSIVTVSSNAAGVPRYAMAAYAASKAAATMFTRCLGLELAGSGVRCNIVAPGSTRTRMQDSLRSDGSGEEAVLAGSLRTFRTGIPLGKLGEPEDVAEAVVFLASERSSHITMAELYVDGGATLRA